MADDSIVKLCIWREARGGTEKDWQGVLSVLRNRVTHRYMGATTTAEVVLKKFQFSSFNWNDPNSQRFPRATDVADWNAWIKISEFVDSEPPDNVNGATHYCNKGLRPSWAEGKTPVAQTDSFDFYQVA